MVDTVIFLLQCLGALVVYVVVVTALIYSPQWKGKGIAWGKAKEFAGRLWGQGTKNISDFFKHLLTHRVELVLLGIGIYLFYSSPPFSDLAPELIGIAVVVLILDYRNKQRQEAQLKAQLIRELESRDNSFTLRAIRELKEYGWLDEALRIADLERANLKKADLKGVDLHDVNLGGANLIKAFLFRADLTGANLLWANLGRANLTGANLRKAYLSGVNFRDSNLWEANLSEADLRGADLRGANLRGANLYKTIIKGAKYNKKPYIDEFGLEHQPTQWPDGFDPTAAGAIDVSEQE